MIKITPSLAVLLMMTTIPFSSAHADTKGAVSEGIPEVATLSSIGLTAAYSDLAYGTVSDAQKLDVYLPDGKEGAYPVVMFVHGGGFAFGDKTMSLPGIVKVLLERNIAVVTVNYRLSGEAQFPAASQDLGRAIEFVRAHGSEYGLDAARLITMGESAGANLVSLSGTAAASEVMRGELLDPATDIRPQGVVALYPPVDFLQMDTLMSEQGCENPNHDAVDSFESIYLGGALQTMRDAATASNPTSYIDESTPPFFVENGSADCQIGTAQSALIVEALKAQNIPTVYTLLEGAGHGGDAFEAADNAAIITDWVLQTVGPRSAQ